MIVKAAEARVRGPAASGPCPGNTPLSSGSSVRAASRTLPVARCGAAAASSCSRESEARRGGTPRRGRPSRPWRATAGASPGGLEPWCHRGERSLDGRAAIRQPPLLRNSPCDQEPGSLGGQRRINVMSLHNKTTTGPHQPGTSSPEMKIHSLYTHHYDDGGVGVFSYLLNH